MDVLQSSPVGAVSVPTAQEGAPTGRGVISSDFETFLKLMTAQLQNQDPLNPIDSSDYAVQLATFAEVEQQALTNEHLTTLGAQMGVMNMGSLGGWLGKEARAPMPAFFDGAPVSITAPVAKVADQARLVVRDGAGTTVQQLDIPLDGDPVTWAGVGEGGSPFPPGLYSFEVESYANGELLSSAPGEVYGTIREAQIRGSDTVLIFEGGAEVAAGSITALREWVGPIARVAQQEMPPVQEP